MPIPRALEALVRLALSNELLYMNGIPRGRVISISAAAVSSAWPQLSMAHGPAIKAQGKSLPTEKSPMRTWRCSVMVF